jgi:hypothetical protein
LTIRTGFLRDAFGLRDELLALGFSSALGGSGSGVFSGAESFDRSLW